MMMVNDNNRGSINSKILMMPTLKAMMYSKDTADQT
jgi:hypothetical protein